jgi:hypothetical protein
MTHDTNTYNQLTRISLFSLYCRSDLYNIPVEMYIEHTTSLKYWMSSTREEPLLAPNSQRCYKHHTGPSITPFLILSISTGTTSFLLLATFPLLEPEVLDVSYVELLLVRTNFRPKRVATNDWRLSICSGMSASPALVRTDNSWDSPSGRDLIVNRSDIALLALWIFV